MEWPTRTEGSTPQPMNICAKAYSVIMISGKLHRRTGELGIRCRLCALFGQPQRAEVVIQLGLQVVQATVHPFGKDRFGFIQFPRHARVLRTAAGEHEHHVGPVECCMGEPTRRGLSCSSRSGGFRMGFRHDHAALVQFGAPLFQRKGHHLPRAARSARADGLPSALRFAPSAVLDLAESVIIWKGQSLSSDGPARRRFFQHDMRVGAANAKAV